MARDLRKHEAGKSELQFRLPPQNIEAEEGVLGSILIDPECLDDVIPILSASDFYRDENAVVFRNIKEMYDEGKPIDGLTLHDWMVSNGSVKRITAPDGFAIYLSELSEKVPHSANAPYYAGIVRSKAVKRQLIEAANQILKDGYDELVASDTMLEDSEQRIFAIGESTAVDRAVHVSVSVDTALDRISGRKNRVSGVATGYPSLDQMTDGLQPGTLIVLAARPTIGKSALALNIARHAAKVKTDFADDGTPVVTSPTTSIIFSLEMPGVDVGSRLLCTESGVYNHKFLDPAGLMGTVDYTAIGDAQQFYRKAPIYIDDSPGMTASQIAARARKHKRKRGAGLVVVDYLQILRAEDPREPRQEQVAKMSRRFQNLARELNVPVVLLSQLNREVENRKDCRPRMSDMRESGAIEQDADVILLLHRPAVYDPGANPYSAEIIVAKNRNGAAGVVEVNWNGPLYQFSPHSRAIGPPIDDGRGSF